MTREHLVVVGGNDSGLPVVELPDAELTLVQSPEKATDRQRAGATRFIEVAELSAHCVRTTLQALHDDVPVTAVACFYEPVLLAAADAAERLGVRCNPGAAVRNARNKVLTRECLARVGIPQLPWRTCHGPAEAARFLAELGGRPAILKPITGAGSAGVRLVRHRGDAVRAWQDLRGLASWALLDNPDLVMLAEQFSDGQEFSVEAMTRDGRHEVLAVTAKSTTGEPHFVEVGHQQPAGLAQGQRHRVEEFTAAVLDAIGHRVGPSHTEVMVDGDDVNLIETHTRFGGDQIWELTWLTTGRHLATETICALLGLDPPPPTTRHGGAAVRFLTHGNPGPVAELEQDPAVLRVVYPKRAVAARKVLRDSSHRDGYVLTVGADASDAATSARRGALLVEEVDRA